jgi:serine/threonine-protein kinase RsbW
MAGGGTMRFTIPSDMGAIGEVQKQILDAVGRCGFSEADTFAIHLALEEGLINAIKHGNQSDPAKKVRVVATVTPAAADITIEDEGRGFDRAEVPDPTLEENLEKCSGRGLLLIESYMTRVEYSCGGRKLHMVKEANGRHEGT